MDDGLRTLCSDPAPPSLSERSALRLAGQSAPLGATVSTRGVNFSLYSRDATGIELLLFDQAEDAKPSHVIILDPVFNRTYHYWHTFVPDVRPGSSMVSALTDHSIQRVECVSSPPKFSSTPTVALS